MQNIIQQTLSNYFQKRYNTLTSSGTSALIILHTLKKFINKDNNLTFCCVSLFALCDKQLIFKTVFVDMELKCFNMNFGHLKKLINKKTLSVICVHCYGIAANIEKIQELLKEKNFLMKICLILVVSLKIIILVLSEMHQLLVLEKIKF